jgi:hypothetical protein
MRYFCRVESAAEVEGSTNLQLYSLKKAAEGWNDLLDLIDKSGEEQVNHFMERLAFILSCLGLSLVQLIGQNSPSPDSEKMGKPGVLLSTLLKRTNADKTTQKFLKSTFQDFLKYYGTIRHFGKNKDEENYRTIERLTLDKLNRFIKMTIKIWDLVVEMYRQDREIDLDEGFSVTDLVDFKELSA